MKQIPAIIRPEYLDRVMNALSEAGYPKMTVTRVMGRGEQGGIKFVSRGKSYNIPLIEKVSIMIIAFDHKVHNIVKIIMENARTERGEGDGKIFILPCERSFKISSGTEVIEEK